MLFFFISCLKNIFRRLFSFLTSVLVLAICLVTLSSAILLFHYTGKALDAVVSRNDFSVFLEPGLSEEEVSDIEAQLTAIPDVEDAVYQSPDVVYKELVANLSGEDVDSDYVSGFSRRNILDELGGGFSVTLTDYFQMEEAMEAAREIEGVSEASGSIQAANGLAATQNTFLMVAVCLGFIALCICLFLVHNSVQLTFYARREELSIMKMVGASNFFILAPFLMEGCLLGLFGGLAAFPIQYGVQLLMQYILVENQLSQYLTASSFDAYARPLLLGLTLSGALLGFLSTLVATKGLMRRHHTF